MSGIFRDTPTFPSKAPFSEVLAFPPTKLGERTNDVGPIYFSHVWQVDFFRMFSKKYPSFVDSLSWRWLGLLATRNYAWLTHHHGPAQVCLTYSILLCVGSYFHRGKPIVQADVITVIIDLS